MPGLDIVIHVRPNDLKHLEWVLVEDISTIDFIPRVVNRGDGITETENSVTLRVTNQIGGLSDSLIA